MLQINQLLSRFKSLTNTEKIKKQLVAEILTKNNFPIVAEQVSLNKNTLFIKTPPIIKTEILLKKEETLKQIQQISGLEKITNIQ